jgi:hypothetical protein
LGPDDYAESLVNLWVCGFQSAGENIHLRLHILESMSGLETPEERQDRAIAPEGIAIAIAHVEHGARDPYIRLRNSWHGSPEILWRNSYNRKWGPVELNNFAGRCPQAGSHPAPAMATGTTYPRN